MAYSEASKRATIKYISNNRDKITLMVPKGERERIYDHAELMGESGTAFIRRAIEETIERDRKDIAERNKAERKAK